MSDHPETSTDPDVALNKLPPSEHGPSFLEEPAVAGAPTVTDEAVGALPDLMRPKDAVTALTGVFGSRKQAKEALIDLLGDGRLTLFADYFWVGSSSDLHTAYRTRKSRESADRKCEIAAKVFRSAIQLQADANQWNWELGNFIVKQSVRRYAVILKSRFVKDEIALLTLTTKPGRSRDETKRDAMWIALIAFACEHGRAGFATHKQVMKQVAEKLGTPSGPNWSKEEIAKSEKTLSNLITEIRKSLGLARPR